MSMKITLENYVSTNIYLFYLDYSKRLLLDIEESNEEEIPNSQQMLHVLVQLRIYESLVPSLHVFKRPREHDLLTLCA